MNNNLLAISFISVSTLVAAFSANKLSAASHKLEISLQNCYYAKIFAKTVMEKKKASRPIKVFYLHATTGKDLLIKKNHGFNVHLRIKV